MNELVIRYGKPEDVGAITELLESYLKESAYSQELYDPELAVIANARYTENGHAILAFENETLVGVCLCSVTYSYWSKAELGMDVFYVTPEHRGTSLANELVGAYVETIKHYDYMFGIGASTSGFGRKVEKQFSNMLQKHGFEPIGRACIFKNF